MKFSPFKLLCLLLLLAFQFSSIAAVKGRFRAYDENRRKHEFEFTLTRKEENRLESKFKKILENFRIQVQKKIAEKKGYAEEIYGKDNHKLIELSRFDYVFYSDDFFKSIVKSNRDIRRLEDF